MQVFQLSLILISLFFIGTTVAIGSGIDVNSAVREAVLLEWQAESAASLIPRGTPTVKRETNAERFRRGLGPLPPARLRSRNFLRPRSSSVPCVPLTSATGTILVTKASDGTPLGVVSQIFDAQNSYTVTMNPALALQVSLPSLSPFATPIDITALNGPDPNHVLFGVVGGSSGFHLESGQLGTAYLSGTGHTDAGQPPSSSAGTSMQLLGYNAPSESQIWTLDCTSLNFTATWTNDDKSQPATTIFYDPQVDYLGLTGDVNVFNGVFNEGCFTVTLTYLPA